MAHPPGLLCRPLANIAANTCVRFTRFPGGAAFPPQGSGSSTVSSPRACCTRPYPQGLALALHTRRCRGAAQRLGQASLHPRYIGLHPRSGDWDRPDLRGGVHFKPAVPASNRRRPIPRPPSLLQAACRNCSTVPATNRAGVHIRAPWVQAPTTRGGGGPPPGPTPRLFSHEVSYTLRA